MRLSRVLAFALLLVTAVTVSAGVPARVSQRGWRPLVVLAGDGDRASAIAGLRRSVRTVGAALNRLDVDEPTLEFVEDLGDSLSSFDLEDFHESLPETDGKWRRVRAIGSLRGESYRIRQLKGKQSASVKRAGDLAVEVRTREVRDNYLFRGELGVGIGKVGWDDIEGSISEAAKLIASADPGVRVNDPAVSPNAKTIAKLKKTHRGLRPGDLEVLGVLWESFPKVGDLVHSIARAERVVIVHQGGDTQQISVQSRLVPRLMETDYPELAEFLEDMGPLAKIDVVWADEKRGLEWARLNIDTQALRLTFGCTVRDGELLAYDYRSGEVIDPAELPGPKRITARTNIRSSVTGIKTNITGMKMHWTYEPNAKGAHLSARVTQTPKVSVSGALGGLMPMPTSQIQSLMREFLSTACKGNGKQGIELDINVEQDATGQCAVTTTGGLEVMDSWLISWGASIANQFLLPDEDVRADLHKLLVRGHKAFASDLARFGRLTPPQ